MLMAALVVVGFVVYVMTPEERRRALRPARIVLRHGTRAADLGLIGVRAYLMALLDRQRWAIASVALLALLIAGAALHARYQRSFTDVRPEIERVLAIEARTVHSYDKAVGQFRLGAIPAEALSNVIEQAVLPELRAARERLTSLERVRPHDQPVLVKADEYLQLRMESWRRRAEALETRNLGALANADRAERDSLAALRAIRLDELR